MKPETIMLLAAAGVGAYFLMSSTPATVTPPASTAPASSFAMPGGAAVLTAPGGGTGAMLNPATFPTFSAGASYPVSQSTLNAMQGSYGLSSATRKRPTIQPGVVPVRGQRTGQRKVGWNV